MNPDIYFFNSTCELAVGNGYHSYMPPARLRAIEDDLELIVSFLAKKEDIVIVNNDVPVAWITFMQDCGFILPQYSKLSNLVNIDINYLKPWGWSPVMHYLFKELYKDCSDSYKKIVNSSWNSEFRDLYSRTFSLNFLETYIKYMDSEDYPLLLECPSILKSLDDLLYLDRLGNSLVMKSPWSSSGRGVRIVDKYNLSKYDKQWINGIIKQYGFIMVEKKFDKIIDFSLQYYINEFGNVSFVGKTSFFTDDEGNYQGTNLHFRDVYRNNEILKEIISKINFQSIVDAHISIIKTTNLNSKYCGFLGIDCLLYNEGEEAKIHPCIEINLRYNMGILALELSEKLHSNYKGYLATKYVKDISSYIIQEKDNNPICFFEEKVISGFINISVPNRIDSFLSFITNYNE